MRRNLHARAACFPQWLILCLCRTWPFMSSHRGHAGGSALLPGPGLSSLASGPGFFPPCIHDIIAALVWRRGCVFIRCSLDPCRGAAVARCEHEYVTCIWEGLCVKYITPQLTASVKLHAAACRPPQVRSACLCWRGRCAPASAKALHQSTPAVSSNSTRHHLRLRWCVIANLVPHSAGKLGQMCAAVQPCMRDLPWPLTTC